MSLTKIIVGVAVFAFCFISLSDSLKCYVCDGKDSCKKAKKYECNQSLANSTSLYLRNYHSGVNVNVTSHNYDCFKEYIETINGDFYKKGCIYSNIKGCSFPLYSHISSSLKKQQCSQCSKDGCNPANRSTIDHMAVFTTIIVAIVSSYKCH